MSTGVDALRAEIAIPRRSGWITVDQSMIDRFADATSDHQFIHVDPVRAAGTPFEGTVAHGFLTLSLLPKLQAVIADGDLIEAKMSVNYGFDRVRFIHPVRAGSRIRGSFTLTGIEEKRPGQFQQSHEVCVEIEHIEKPALTALWLSQLFI
ncbi:nodulation protein NodN [Sphingobium sp. SCG-1]|uniref:MaoC family dehydratase n=1 Tax=Sphingobium sp. SCG-1 TaxID=2072936 RepID=UPI000CD69A11|nr:MaoC family dehydratase [Sphingobium sp. SCG-1]AUW56982.1 nodulation protein NodN [Sphingobium sp. SCG-1]